MKEKQFRILLKTYLLGIIVGMIITEVIEITGWSAFIVGFLSSPIFFISLKATDHE